MNILELIFLVVSAMVMLLALLNSDFDVFFGWLGAFCYAFMYFNEKENSRFLEEKK